MLCEKRKHQWPIVVYDSSILIDMIECKVDPITEVERVLSTRFAPTILSGTLRELEDNLKRSKGEKRRKMLMLVLKIANKFNKLDYGPVDDEDMDDVIIRAVRDFTAVVATNDSKLRKTLVKAGIPVLFVREKSHVEIDGYLNDLGDRPPDSADHCEWLSN